MASIATSKGIFGTGPVQIFKLPRFLTLPRTGRASDSNTIRPGVAETFSFWPDSKPAARSNYEKGQHDPGHRAVSLHSHTNHVTILARSQRQIAYGHKLERRERNALPHIRNFRLGQRRRDSNR